jgi:hypothetical protein
VVTKEPAKPVPATKTKTTPAKQKPKPSTTTPTPPGTTTARKPAPQVKATKPAKPKQPAPPAAGRLLRWHAPAAPYYDLVLWHDGHRVYDAWPTTTSFRIPRTWTYGGRSHRLEPGTYLWFVYPGIGPRSRARYGPLAASGTFTVR